MKRVCIVAALACLWLLDGMPAVAEMPSSPASKAGSTVSPGEVTPTPEMWFYEQYRRQYQDPKFGVRQKAEFRAGQRQDRIASRRWFGFSNQRPVAGSDPFHSDYSPSWTANNAHYPFRWGGVNGATLVVRAAQGD